MQNARRSGVFGNRDLQCEAAAEIVSSSVRGEFSHGDFGQLRLGVDGNRDLLVTSSSRTSSLSLSTSKPSKIRCLVPCRSFRAVATTGKSQILSR